MKTQVQQVTVTSYRSDVVPELVTGSSDYAEVIAWADAHPVVYKILQTTKSEVFGRDGSVYMGFQRGKSPEALLERLVTFHRLLDQGEGPEAEWDFWRDRARHTLEHFEKKGFKTGFFKQHAIHADDGKEYDRACVSYDYTPETLEMVTERFWKWANNGWYPNTTRITCDGKDVRVFDVSSAYVAAMKEENPIVVSDAESKPKRAKTRDSKNRGAKRSENMGRE